MSTSQTSKEEVSTIGGAEAKPSGVSRRKFLGGVGGAAAVMAAGGLGIEPLVKGGSAAHADIGPLGANQRATSCWKFRKDAADFNRKTSADHADNGDEARYANKIGSYSKGLPHNSFGEVDLGAYGALINALSSGDPRDFDNLVLGSTSPFAKQTNPQSGLALDLQGSDSHAMNEPAPPALASAEGAGEAIELYWMALLRDVNYNDYATNPLAAAAAAELSAASVFNGPKNGAGQVTPQTLFRDTAPGCTVGPYLSQFNILNTPFGAEYVVRQIRTFLPGNDQMTSFPEFLNVQNGGAPSGSLAFDPVRRYIRNARDFAAFVHVDILFQAYFNACLLLIQPPDPSDPLVGGGIGCPLNPGNPYRNNRTQIGFGTFGPPAIKALMCEVASRALKAQWYQKWFVHRRLRPEAFGGVLHVKKTSGRYPAGTLHNDILSSQAVAQVHAKTGSYLLPAVFPEGSPTHPSYGSGHATVAGACVTILKALFDENFVIQHPKVVSSDGLALTDYSGPALTVGGELNKLASNVSQARNSAGVHWRSDAHGANRLGQAVAVSILRDQRAGYNEVFNGFTFTGFDGETITI
jgi:membrane-associated phospholipid phosphatase